VIVKVKYK